MKVKFNEKLLTEGPGAGYSIKWSVDNIYSTNVSDVVFDIGKQDYSGATHEGRLVINANIECKMECSVTIDDASSYYYSIPHPIEVVDAVITRIYVTDLDEAYGYYVKNEGDSYVVYGQYDWRGQSETYGSFNSLDAAYDEIISLVKTEVLENVNDPGYIMDILKTMTDHYEENTFEFVFGGGYSHSTFDGRLHDSNDCIDAEILDKDIIDFIDKAVQGENYYISYRVDFIDGSFDYFDTEEEVINGVDDEIESISKVKEWYDEKDDIVDVDEEDVTDGFI